jgi:hypothetical protein
MKSILVVGSNLFFQILFENLFRYSIQILGHDVIIFYH